MLKVNHYIALFVVAAAAIGGAASGQGFIQKFLMKPRLSGKFSITQGDVLARPITSKLGRIGCVSVNTKDKSAPIVTTRPSGSTSISLSEVEADVYSPPGKKPILIQIANVDANKIGIISSAILTFSLEPGEWSKFESNKKLFIFNKELQYSRVQPQYDAGEQCLQHP